MSFSAIAGVFLKLPRLFLRICRWVLVRMALHCKASSFNGGFSTSSKAKERPRGSNSWKWRRMLLVLWAVSGIIGSIWVFHDLSDSSFSRKDKIIDAWPEKVQLLQQQSNVSNDKVEALATLFSKSEQVCMLGLHNFSFSLFFFSSSVSSTQIPVNSKNFSGNPILEDSCFSVCRMQTEISAKEKVLVCLDWEGPKDWKFVLLMDAVIAAGSKELNFFFLPPLVFQVE